MKGTRYLVIALAIIAVVATVGWLLRNSIIERISGPMLAELDIELIDVSLDALAADAASISYLELVHAKGTRVVVEYLSLPISTSGNELQVWTAGKVTIVTSSRDEGAPFELARLIDQFLSLSDNFANTEIRIVEFSLSPYADVRDLTWTLSAGEQRLGGSIESVHVSAMTRRASETNHDIGLSLARRQTSDNDEKTISVTGTLELTDDGVSISGGSELELSNWQTFASLTSVLPSAIQLRSGNGELRFEAAIPFDVTEASSVSATLAPSSPWQVGYIDESGNSTDILLRDGSDVDFRASFPTVEWSVQQADAALSISRGEWRDIPLSISNLSCHSTDDGWQLHAVSVDTEIDSLSLNDDITISPVFFLEDVEVRSRDGIVSASTMVVAPSSEAVFDDRMIELPGIAGEVSFKDTEVAFNLATTDLSGNGTINGSHNVDSGVGRVEIMNAEIDLSDRPLSTRVVPLGFDFDISRGKVAADLRATWRPTDSDSRIDTRASVRVNELAGYYTDIAFAGLATELAINYNGDGLTVAPTTIDVGLIDMGLPINNVTADVALNVYERSFEVENLEMTAFNGVITAAPFSFDTARPANNIVLTAREIQLSQLLAVEDFAAVDVTGTIGAELPITILEDGILIDGGKLTGEAPGGVIRYLAGGEPDDTDASSIGLVTAALSNFEYDSMTSDVTYNKAGDLHLQMQLKGQNPELDEGRPIVLNLAVENNVPQMLKSLQAARAVEDILENQLAN